MKKHYFFYLLGWAVLLGFALYSHTQETPLFPKIMGWISGVCFGIALILQYKELKQRPGIVSCICIITMYVAYAVSYIVDDNKVETLCLILMILSLVGYIWKGVPNDTEV